MIDRSERQWGSSPQPPAGETVYKHARTANLQREAQQTARALMASQRADHKVDIGIKIMLIGMIGTGKSQLANALLDREAARVDTFGSGTQRVQVHRGAHRGLALTVIDTPGLYAAGTCTTRNMAILRSIKAAYTKHKPTFVFYVDRLDCGRPAIGEQAIMGHITAELGPEIWAKAMVILTHANSAKLTMQPQGYEQFVHQRRQFITQIITMSCTRSDVFASQSSSHIDLASPPHCGSRRLPNQPHPAGVTAQTHQLPPPPASPRSPLTPDTAPTHSDPVHCPQSTVRVRPRPHTDRVLVPSHRHSTLPHAPCPPPPPSTPPHTNPPPNLPPPPTPSTLSHTHPNPPPHPTSHPPPTHAPPHPNPPPNLPPPPDTRTPQLQQKPQVMLVDTHPDCPTSSQGNAVVTEQNQALQWKVNLVTHLMRTTFGTQMTEIAKQTFGIPAKPKVDKKVRGPSVFCVRVRVGVRLTFDEWTFDEWTFDDWTFDEWTFDEWTFDDWTFDDWTLDEWTLDEWTFDDWTFDDWTFDDWTFDDWTFDD
ncbi:MAG: hypothetical protein WDW36_010305 [Sanguina aurantia]